MHSCRFLHLVLLLGGLVTASPPAIARDAAASGQATATVIRAISAKTISDLDFGWLSANAGSDGTVTIDPASGLAHYTGGAQAACAVATDCAAPRPALFAVSGEPERQYRVAIPAALDTRLSGRILRVDRFTVRTDSQPASGVHGKLDGNGRDGFALGARLHVPAGMPMLRVVVVVPVAVTYD